MSNGFTVLPIGLWSEKPISHYITSIFISPFNDHIVTGSFDGTIIIWSFEKDKIIPKWSVFSLSSSCKNIVYGGCIRSEQYAVCLSNSNEFCVLRINDGTCHELKVDVRYQHKQIKSYKSYNLDYNYIMAHGSYNQIIVMHGISLNYLFYLDTNELNCNILGFVVFSLASSSQDVILGITSSSKVNLWTLNGQETKGVCLKPNESKSIANIHSAICLDHSIVNPRIVLIITSLEWMMLDAFICQIIVRKESPNNETFVYGSFISDDVILIQTSNGNCYIYHYSSKVKTKDSFENDVKLIALLSPSMQITPFLKSKPLQIDASGLRMFHKTSSSIDAEGVEYINVLTSTLTCDGTLFSWVIPKKRIIQLANETGKYSRLRPKSISSLRDVWKEHSPTGLSTLHSQYEEKSDRVHITASILVYSCSFLMSERANELPSDSNPDSNVNSSSAIPPRLILGLSNGDILISRFKESIEKLFSNSQDSETSLNASFYQYPLIGHKGPITALLHPTSEQYHCHLQYLINEGNILQRDVKQKTAHLANCLDPVLLLSASEDSTVRLWNLNPTFEKQSSRTTKTTYDNGHIACLHVFNCFSAPIDQFIVGPPNFNGYHEDASSIPYYNFVVAKCRDGTINLLNLKERKNKFHFPDTFSYSAPRNSTNQIETGINNFVVAIGWRISEGLFFMIKSNLSLVVWDLHTGCIDRHETSSSAVDIWESVEWKCLICDIQQIYPLFHSPLGASSETFSKLIYQTNLQTILGENLLQPMYIPTSSYSCGSQNNHQGTIQKNGFMPLLQDQRHSISPVNYLRLGKCMDLPSSSACSLLLWDLERIITYVMTENHTFGCIDDPKRSPYLISNGIVSLNSVGLMIRFLLSICHPWGQIPEMDSIMKRILNISTNDDAYLNLKDNSIAYGVISDRGTLTISLPGYRGKMSPDSTMSHIRHFYLSNIISSNMTVMSLSLCEVFTTISKELAEFLLNLSSEHASNVDKMFRDYATFICKEYLQWINKGHTCDPSPIIFYSLLSKWQDPCLQIRYASRTLLISILDTIGPQGRNQLVTWWQKQLPPWIVFSHNNAIPNSTQDKSKTLAIDVGSSSKETPMRVSNSNLSLPILGSHGVGSIGVKGEGDPFSWLQSDFHTDWPRLITEAKFWCPIKKLDQSEKLQMDNNAISLLLISILVSRYTSDNDIFISPFIAARDRQIYKSKFLEASNEKLVTPSEKRAYLSKAQGYLYYRGLASPLFQEFQKTKNPNSSANVGIQMDHDLSRNLYNFSVNCLLNNFPLLTPGTLNCDLGQFNSANENQQRLSQCINRANEITRILITSPGHSLTTNFGLLKRSLIDLLGRTFSLWQAYSDVSQLFNGLLSVLANSKNLLDSLNLSANFDGQPFSDVMDMVFCVRECLWSIGFSNPQLLTINLSLEVKKFKSQTNNQAPVSNQVEDRIGKNQLSNLISPIQSSRLEILHLLEVLCIHRPVQMSEVLVDLLEIILACADKTKLKDRGLYHIAPILNSYSCIASSVKAQKVCVGSKNGYLTFFDYKTGRFHHNQEHTGSINAVAFHQDGKLMASYSEDEKLIKIWQLSTAGMFFNIGSTSGQQLKMLSSHPVPPLAPPPIPNRRFEASSDQQTHNGHNPEAVIYSYTLDWIDTKSLNLINISGITRGIKLS